ncbi:MAG: hypothetical protein ACREF5_03185 [Candidatus Saccharimonadales bacterium]
MKFSMQQSYDEVLGSWEVPTDKTHEQMLGELRTELAEDIGLNGIKISSTPNRETNEAERHIVIDVKEDNSDSYREIQKQRQGRIYETVGRLAVSRSSTMQFEQRSGEIIDVQIAQQTDDRLVMAGCSILSEIERREKLTNREIIEPAKDFDLWRWHLIEASSAANGRIIDKTTADIAAMKAIREAESEERQRSRQEESQKPDRRKTVFSKMLHSIGLEKPDL